MEKTEWGLLVVNYLFLAGVSAGAFAISSFATYLGGPHFRRVAQIGAGSRAGRARRSRPYSACAETRHGGPALRDAARASRARR